MKLALALLAALIPSVPQVPFSEIPQNPIGEVAIVDRFVPFGYARAHTRVVDTIVEHSIFAPGTTEPYNVDNILAVMRRYNVSSHYIIARDGMVYRLVREEDVSYHAGVSKMPAPDGRTGVNQFSIGIELINGYDDHPTEAQYLSLQTLMRSVRLRHPIRYVVAHGEIAGDRRTDPWNLDWERIKNW